MKTFFVIDTITDDRSIDQLNHLTKILELENSSPSLALHPENRYQLKSVHLATETFSEAELIQADAVIFSGSVKSVYEEFSWKPQMHRTFDLIIEHDIPALAVCFGAQFLAQYLGAVVSKNPLGLEFGPIQVELTEQGKLHPLLQTFTDKYLFATHHDYIESTPPGATLLAWNDNTPVQAFQYGPIFASQFHMDIPTERACKLLVSRKQKYLDCGFLKNEKQYQDLYASLPQAAESHEILHQFIQNPDLARLKSKQPTI